MKRIIFAVSAGLLPAQVFASQVESLKDVIVQESEKVEVFTGTLKVEFGNPNKYFLHQADNQVLPLLVPEHFIAVALQAKDKEVEVRGIVQEGGLIKVRNMVEK